MCLLIGIVSVVSNVTHEPFFHMKGYVAHEPFFHSKGYIFIQEEIIVKTAPFKILFRTIVPISFELGTNSFELVTNYSRMAEWYSYLFKYRAAPFS